MEPPNPETSSNNGHSNVNDFNALVSSFRCLKMKEHGTNICHLSGSSSSSATQNQETQEATQGLSRNPVLDHDSNNLGETCSGLRIGSLNFNGDHINSLYLSENFEGSSIGTSNDILHGSISQVENYGLFSPNYNQTSFDGFYNPWSNLCCNDGLQIGSNGFHSQKILKWTEFLVLLDSVFSLMIDEQGHRLFSELIDSCNCDQLRLVVSKLLSNQELFIDAAFTRPGSTSIRKIIKKLKWTSCANMITTILSSRFYSMMTHNIARHVILQCLNILDRKSNEILYKCAIFYCEAMAINEVGCRSLNECIDTIAGDQRDELLHHIADVSDFLANDPYGNYVVQHVLSLRNNPITKKILHRLQDQFVQLSRMRGGSHVVEKCIESSAIGARLVVKEIMDTPRAPIALALHRYGNFVIQRALVATKREGQMDVHKSLVKILEQYKNQIKVAKNGTHVVTLLDKLGEAKFDS